MWTTGEAVDRAFSDSEDLLRSLQADDEAYKDKEMTVQREAPKGPHSSSMTNENKGKAAPTTETLPRDRETKKKQTGEDGKIKN